MHLVSHTRGLVVASETRDCLQGGARREGLGKQSWAGRVRHRSSRRWSPSWASGAGRRSESESSPQAMRTGDRQSTLLTRCVRRSRERVRRKRQLGQAVRAAIPEEGTSRKDSILSPARSGTAGLTVRRKQLRKRSFQSVVIRAVPSSGARCVLGGLCRRLAPATDSIRSAQM